MKTRSNQNNYTRGLIAVVKSILALILLAVLGFMLFSCTEEPVKKLAGCAEESTMAPGPHWVIEANTLSQQPNLVLSVEHITTEHLVRVVHENAITTLTLDSEPGDYKVGLVVCGSGSSGLQYTMKVVKPNGSVTNINASVGTMYVVTVQQ